MEAKRLLVGCSCFDVDGDNMSDKPEPSMNGHVASALVEAFTMHTELNSQMDDLRKSLGRQPLALWKVYEVRAQVNRLSRQLKWVEYRINEANEAEKKQP